MNSRRVIVDSIFTQLQKITVANGFKTDAGANLFLWLDKPLAEEQYPAILIRDSGIQTTQENTYRNILSIDIECYAVYGINNLRDVHDDILKVMYEIENIINIPISYKGGDYKMEQADLKYFGSSSQFEVIYNCARGLQ